MAEPALDSATEAAAPDAEEARSQRAKRLAGWLLFGLALIFITWLVLHYVATVPSTIGMSEARARNVLRAAGFKTSVNTRPSTKAQEGRVIVQAPSAGRLYFTWSPVQVSVGTGVGATATTGSGGTVPFVVETGPSGVETLTAAETTPEVMPFDPEEMAPLFKPVISGGPLMPDVQNLSESSALSVLRDEGLTVTIRRGPSTTDVLGGRVYYQDPAPGYTISRGQTVLIWVSEGPFNVLSGAWSGYPYPRPEH